jgi:SAM-dependent methyltransferase
MTQATWVGMRVRSMPAIPAGEGTSATYRPSRAAPGTVVGVQERARSFDAVADLYDELRPRYPDALFDDLLACTGVPPRPEVLEIGPGPGVATLPLAERGCRILGLEPGPNLAAAARSRVATFADVEIRETTFEDAELTSESFDLVVSASAWHWVDPDVGLEKAARVLRRGGWLGVWWGHGTIADPVVLADLRAVHERWVPHIAETRYDGQGRTADDRIDALQGRRRRSELDLAIGEQGSFSPAELHPYPFDTTYDAQQFVRLLDTYSDYRLLDGEVRQQLFDDVVAMLEQRHGGRVTRHYSPTLYLARRVS